MTTVPTIETLVKKVGICPGYHRVMWAEVREGDTVYLWCQHDGKPLACGPHTVINQRARMLRNLRGQSFWHYSEELLVRN